VIYFNISHIAPKKLAMLFPLYTANKEHTETAKICGSGTLSDSTVKYFQLWSPSKSTLRCPNAQKVLKD